MTDLARRPESAARHHAALQNALAFLAGPGLAAMLIGAWAAAFPPDFAHPSQAAALNPMMLAPLLLLGAAGIYASVHSEMTPDPLRAANVRLPLAEAIGSGLVLGLIVVALDYATDFSGIIAQRLQIDTIHIDFPGSLFVYAAGAIVVECLYRLIPIGLLYFLIARLALRGRGEAALFWIFATLTSLFEPLSQAALAGDRLLVWLLSAVIFAFNLIEASLWRRYGWVALIASRLTFYLIWHVLLGPII